MVTYLWKSAKAFTVYLKLANSRKIDLLNTWPPTITFNVLTLLACSSTKPTALYSLWLSMIFSSSTKAAKTSITCSILYKITTDFSRDSLKYVGITLRHDRKKRHIDMSIPGYVVKALRRFQRIYLKGADSPIIYVPPSYGKHQ